MDTFAYTTAFDVSTREGDAYFLVVKKTDGSVLQGCSKCIVCPTDHI